MYPNLQELDTIITSFQNMKNETTSSIVPPLVQKQIITKENKISEHYVDQKKGEIEYAITRQKSNEILSKFNKDYQCKTLPPLLVRYQGDKDLHLPIILLYDGELTVNYKQIPDLILHFLFISQTILVSFCKMNHSKLEIYKFVEKVLYRMESKTPLTLEKFQILYDLTRFAS